MNICLCQYNIEWEDKQKNKEKIIKILSSIRNVNLIVFPEMSLSGFSFNKKATTLARNDIDFFSSIAESKKAFVCFGGIVKEKNSCIVINPKGKVILSVAKIHLFSPSKESSYHKPGSAIKSFRLGTGSITPLICYDLRFAPLFWLAATKTDIYTVIANWPISRRNHWKTLLVARAIENQAFVIGVNRIGKSPYEDYCGESCVIDPQGRIIFDAENKHGAFVVDIEIRDVYEIRKSFPVLKDRKKLSDYNNLGG
ncbi:MAG: carbon-nitrogen family hydrolase [Candidatus Omnitrophica bacterium]|nr:carbon-nitrogen family hydrolase [Candidatus Omnitrophota bacterium]MCM8789221.1 carbon-nitrogen family hydrolase [Candidatus Omnitrophota bacterium]